MNYTINDFKKALLNNRDFRDMLSYNTVHTGIIYSEPGIYFTDSSEKNPVLELTGIELYNFVVKLNESFKKDKDRFLSNMFLCLYATEFSIENVQNNIVNNFRFIDHLEHLMLTINEMFLKIHSDVYLKLSN